MEAMKMENEIRAHQAGKVSHVKVTEGKTVETGADLILLEPN
jgi:biotin carboxyl carrier protein